MNIIVDDDDFPLIIKVASLPGTRMQVYFLDNDDFFKRKTVFSDDSGVPFDDNADRMVFFCKGAIETVRKFGWPPDIIHCHGWMTSLIPLYVREAYKTEPLFQQSKIVYSVYDSSLDQYFPDNFRAKASINNLEQGDLNAYMNGSGVCLHKGAIAFSDAVIKGSEHLPASVEALVEESGKPVLDFLGVEDFAPAYLDFYHALLEEEEVIEQ
jgi:starch synthase